MSGRFVSRAACVIEGREGGGGVTIPFPSRNFSKIPVPVGFLLKIPGFLLKIPVNKKIGIYRFKKKQV